MGIRVEVKPPQEQFKPNQKNSRRKWERAIPIMIEDKGRRELGWHKNLRHGCE